jgi:small GTP-binding protein
MYDYLAKVVLIGPSGTGKSCILHRFVKSEWRVLSSQTIGVEFSSKIVKIGSGSNRRRIKLQLWDTAGTERFRSVSRSYYRGAAGAILVYDVTSLASFNALPTFLSDARALASPNLAVILAGNKSDLSDGSQRPNIHINGNAQRQSETIGNTPSSASSRQSYLPYDAGGGTSAGTTRSRGDSINLSGTSNKWTATVSSEGREVSSDQASRWASKALVPVTMEVSAFTGENVDELFNRLGRTILTKIELGEIDPDDPASGIQYGDGGGYGDGASVRSGMTGGNDDGTGTLRRRHGKRQRTGLLSGLTEWEDVFRRPPSRGGGRCC